MPKKSQSYSLYLVYPVCRKIRAWQEQANNIAGKPRKYQQKSNSIDKKTRTYQAKDDAKREHLALGDVLHAQNRPHDGILQRSKQPVPEGGERLTHESNNIDKSYRSILFKAYNFPDIFYFRQENFLKKKKVAIFIFEKKGMKNREQEKKKHRESHREA